MTVYPISSARYNPPSQPVSDLGNLIYPPDLVLASGPTPARAFYLQIAVHKYDRPDIFASPKVDLQYNIVLPLPIKINDVQTIVWQADNVTTRAMGIVSSLGQEVPVLSQALPIIEGIGGFVVNPLLTMLFKTQSYREFTFQWSFAPNNIDDSNRLQNILIALKKCMLPTGGSTNGGISAGTLGYPNLIKPVLYAGSSPNGPDNVDGSGYLFPFKFCAIKNLGIDYSGGNGPSFHPNGSPSIIDVTLQFTEIELWFQEDFIDTNAGSGTDQFTYRPNIQ